MTCTSCNTNTGGAISPETFNAAGGSGVNDSAAPSVTYDEGKGKKTNVVISGPMSEVLAEQLGIIFKKEASLAEVKQDGGLDLSQISQETIVQDTAVANMLAQASVEPRNETVLYNFDVKSIQEHLANIQKNTPTSEDAGDTAIVNVVAGNYQQLLDSGNILDNNPTEFMKRHEFLLVDDLEGNNSLVAIGGGRAQSVSKLWNKARTEVFDSIPVDEKLESLKRVFGDDVVHTSVEALAQALIKKAGA